jgi:hypothetical protein
MGTWKIPPKAKIFEALSAIGDDRVKLKGDEKAEVASSDRSKTYLVEWSPDLRQITSNDNASYWQGYMGYPIVAVLMLLGKVQFSRDVADLLAGIPWKKINKRFRNDYNKAVESVLESLQAKGASREAIVAHVDTIMAQLENLTLEKPPRRRRPPEPRKT